MTLGTDRGILGLRQASVYTLLNIMQPEGAAASSQLRAAPRRYFHTPLPGSVHWNLKRKCLRYDDSFLLWKWVTAWWFSGSPSKASLRVYVQKWMADRAPPHESLVTCVYALWGATPTCQPSRELQNCTLNHPKSMMSMKCKTQITAKPCLPSPKYLTHCWSDLLCYHFLSWASSRSTGTTCSCLLLAP